MFDEHESEKGDTSAEECDSATEDQDEKNEPELTAMESTLSRDASLAPQIDSPIGPNLRGAHGSQDDILAATNKKSEQQSAVPERTEEEFENLVDQFFAKTDG